MIVRLFRTKSMISSVPVTVSRGHPIGSRYLRSVSVHAIAKCIGSLLSAKRDRLTAPCEAPQLMTTEEDDRRERARSRALMASRRRLAQTELIDEIVATAERITAAQSFGGEPIVKTDTIWRLLSALEHARYCCSISDAARLLRVPKQRLHETARKAGSSASSSS